MYAVAWLRQEFVVNCACWDRNLSALDTVYLSRSTSLKAEQPAERLAKTHVFNAVADVCFTRAKYVGKAFWAHSLTIARLLGP